MTADRARIFISYRREDSEHAVARLAEDLGQRFAPEQVFHDIASIDPGADFVEALQHGLDNCAAVLVVIGPRWLRAADAEGRRRLDRPDDWVRHEVAESLKRVGVRVFPVLVGADMPDAEELPEPLRPLTRRQAFSLTIRHWANDVEELVRHLKNIPGLTPSPPVGHTPADEREPEALPRVEAHADRGAPDAGVSPTKARLPGKALAGLGLAVTVVVALYWLGDQREWDTAPAPLPPAETTPEPTPLRAPATAPTPPSESNQAKSPADIRQELPARSRRLLDGKWLIDATEKTPKTYLELKTDGRRLSGSTYIPFEVDMAFAGLVRVRRTEILDGKVEETRFSFSTRLQYKTSRYTPGMGSTTMTHDLVRHYLGRMEGDKLFIEVKIEGGDSEEVIAERVVDRPPAVDLVATLEGHRGCAAQVAALPDGTLASASSDRTVKIWNASTFEELASLEHGEPVAAVLPLAGESHLLTKSDKLRIWDLRAGKEVQRTFQEAADGSLDDNIVSLGNGRMAGSWSAGSWQPAEITIWNITTGGIVKTLQYGQGIVLKLALLPDGRLATGDSTGGIKLWTLDSGQSVVVKKGARNPNGRESVTSLVALRDGRLAYSTADGKEVTIWNPLSGKVEMSLPSKKRVWAKALAVVDDGRIAMDDSNGDLTLTDPSTGKSDLLLNLDDEKWAVCSLTQLPDGRLAIGMGNGQITIWKLRRGA